MNSPRLHTSAFTPVNTSNVFTSTIQDETSFSSYHVTPRQGVTPHRSASQFEDPSKLEQINENHCEDSFLEANSETYREVIKQLSTQLQLTIVENRELSARLNLLESEQSETYRTVNTQNQELQDSNFTLQQKINNLIHEISLSQAQIIEKDQKIKELRHLETNVDKLNQLLEENSKLISIIETQQAEIKLQKEVISQYERAFQDQQKANKLKEKEKENEILKQEVEMYKSQAAQMQEQIVLWNTRYQSLDSNYQIQLQEFVAKFNYSQNQLAELQQQLAYEGSESTKKIQQLQTVVAELKQELKQKRSQSANDKTKRLESQIADLQEQLTFKKNQITQLKEDLVQQQEIRKLSRGSEPKVEPPRFSFSSYDEQAEQIHQKYEQRIRQLENQIRQGSIQGGGKTGPESYYSRPGNEAVRMQLFSEKKDNMRGMYSFAKENIPDSQLKYDMRGRLYQQ